MTDLAISGFFFLFDGTDVFDGVVRFQVAGNDLTFTGDGTPENPFLADIATAGGLVVGPASSTDNAIVVYDGTTGKIIKNQAFIEIPSGATKGTLHLFETAAGGTNKIILTVPDTLAADVTLVLPPDDGDDGQLLGTDGAGVLTFRNPGGVRPRPGGGTSGIAAGFEFVEDPDNGTNKVTVQAAPNMPADLFFIFPATASGANPFDIIHDKGAGELEYLDLETISPTWTGTHTFDIIKITPDSTWAVSLPSQTDLINNGPLTASIVTNAETTAGHVKLVGTLLPAATHTIYLPLKIDATNMGQLRRATGGRITITKDVDDGGDFSELESVSVVLRTGSDNLTTTAMTVIVTDSTGWVQGGAGATPETATLTLSPTSLANDGGVFMKFVFKNTGIGSSDVEFHILADGSDHCALSFDTDV